MMRPRLIAMERHRHARRGHSFVKAVHPAQERGAHAFGEARDVVVHLALRDHAVLVRVVILDGVLDRDDMAVLVLVDPVDPRGERGGLARAGRAGDEDQAAWSAQQVLDHRGQAELLERVHLGRDEAQDHAEHALAAVDVDAETGLLVEGEAEVAPAVALEALQLLRRQRGQVELAAGGAPERRVAADGQVDLRERHYEQLIRAHVVAEGLRAPEAADEDYMRAAELELIFLKDLLNTDG